ncbi:hypothetical protein, partial [Streptomyces sp. KL116D]|uniref:hypothetical protein n=1 Tax=Streptomyces sp. KL116D TaxID=3045152 RepID=UPI003556248C
EADYVVIDDGQEFGPLFGEPVETTPRRLALNSRSSRHSHQHRIRCQCLIGRRADSPDMPADLVSDDL